MLNKKMSENLHIVQLLCDLNEYGYNRFAGTPMNYEQFGAIGETFISNPEESKTSCAVLLEFSERRILICPGTLTEFVKPIAKPRLALHSLLDWIQNLKAYMVRDWKYYCPGMLHKGFLEEFHAISNEIMRTIKLHIDKFGHKPVIVTGHSQGGAIAQICTMSLNMIGFIPESCITFAAPKVGNEAFSLAAESNLKGVFHRFEYGFDIVPHVPLSFDLSNHRLPLLSFLHKALPGENLKGDLTAAPGFEEVQIPALTGFNGPKFDYAPVGSLNYRSALDTPTNYDVGAQAETGIRTQRSSVLSKGWAKFFEHHHLTTYRDMLTTP